MALTFNTSQQCLRILLTLFRLWMSDLRQAELLALALLARSVAVAAVRHGRVGGRRRGREVVVAPVPPAAAVVEVLVAAVVERFLQLPE